MADFVKVATLSEVPVGTMKTFEVKYDRVLVAHTENGVFAVADECSHDSAPISTGRMKGNQVICPRHGARFNLETGAVEAPPAVVGIDSYEVRVDGEDIYVKLD